MTQKIDKDKMIQDLSQLQLRLLKENRPVLIIVEGYECSGKGYFINKLTRAFDPRGFKVHGFTNIKGHDRYPTLINYWKKLPKKGEIAVFDRSYYQSIIDKLDYDKTLLKDINNFEKSIVDNGTILIKFFVDVDKKTQKKRIKKLDENQFTKFRISKFDHYQNRNFEKYSEHISDVIMHTESEYKWSILDGSDKTDVLDMYKITYNLIKRQLDKVKTFNHKEKENPNILSDVDLNKEITREEYDKKLKKLQKEAEKLQYKLYTLKKPVVIVFEGWDAAGKGGAIKRLTKKIDPRGYDVYSISKPTDHENKFHYLWRFANNIPKTGHITIFDRSWYGRVMVERVEGFCSEDEWKNAFKEINDFEAHLKNNDVIVIKYFMHLDKDKQLDRFKQRENNPLKKHKITEEDYRNREKWDQYEEAINRMLYETKNWIIVESNDKLYARIKVLETFIKKIKKNI